MIFNSILIANRGEIACRVIKTAKEMGIRSVAVYVDADKDAPFVKDADESVKLKDGGYLDADQIIEAALKTDAQAIHPGYGFLAENAKFSKICKENHIKFIGASAEMINSMGDKAKAKETMKRAGVPTIPGSKGIIKDFNSLKKIALEIGYPVMLKATAGGGGKGMRLVWKEEELKSNWENAKNEAKASFGDDGMYLEKFIEKPRHIEIQIISDQKGRAAHLSERDCSIQRRHQKLVEEAPCPTLTDEERNALGDAAVKAASAVSYNSAGTLEFLYEDNEFYFMEMNTRLQVEHPVTEMVTGIDLVKEQILVANGEKLTIKQEDIKLKGSSIECRINAEHPESFIPSPGKITQYHQPGGLGIRVDSAVYDGYSIPSHYDSMIGKLITYGATRSEALKKMNRALEEYVIMGINTNIQLHQKIIQTDEFKRGSYNINFMSNLIE